MKVTFAEKYSVSLVYLLWSRCRKARKYNPKSLDTRERILYFAIKSKPSKDHQKRSLLNELGGGGQGINISEFSLPQTHFYTFWSFPQNLRFFAATSCSIKCLHSISLDPCKILLLYESREHPSCFMNKKNKIQNRNVKCLVWGPTASKRWKGVSWSLWWICYNKTQRLGGETTNIYLSQF